MATIVRYPLVRHLRGTETTHVRHVRNGKVLHEGTGGSFWFRPLSAVLSEVPVDDRELPLQFHAQTLDFQDVAVQATVTFRLDPELAAQRIDFSISPESGLYLATPLAQVGTILAETTQQHALGVLARSTLTQALTVGIVAVRDAVSAGLAADGRLAQTGISVVGTRVVAIRPEPEVERALQTPTREQLQQESDKATYERRAMAVERERAIAENELQNQIELARREEQLVTQNGLNGRRSAEEDAAADEIRVGAEAARSRRLEEARAQGIRMVGEAEGESEAARLAAYREISEGVLFALALKELAGSLPHIEHLVLTPDLLTSLAARFGRTAGPEELAS
jgi:regulator of protease activity HflC (stomatin/prohibitin superfamily)